MARAATYVAIALAAIVCSGLIPDHAGTNLISSTCERTKDAALCVAVLTADPRSGRASSVRGLTDVALNITADTAAENFRVVEFRPMRRLRMSELDAASVCRAAYAAAAKELSFDARTSLNEDDDDGASRLVASAQGAGDRCEDAFKEVDTEYAVTDMNRQMTEGCVVARGLIELLASSSSCCCCCGCSNKISYYLCTLFF